MVNYTLRLPDEMYARITEAARRDVRSRHAEMLHMASVALTEDDERLRSSPCNQADTCLMADDCPFVADCREVEAE